MTEQSDALQLLQLREPVLYAFLDDLRHELRTLEPHQAPLNFRHARAGPTYSGDPAQTLARADVTCALGPAFSVSAASAVGEALGHLRPLSPPCGRLWYCREGPAFSGRPQGTGVEGRG